jgi:gluconokinase
MVIIVMGVSGSGKSTVGRLLADELGWTFVEADDFHPPENIRKMHAGIPLNDADRQPWLTVLQGRIDQACADGENLVLACSALKDDYRDLLEQHHPETVVYVYLHGSEKLIAERLAARKGHFMNSALLHSQFEALQPPENAVSIDITHPPEEIVAEIRRRLKV